jgi:hydroxymethylpyrimidine kinase/phosphomethylpyrimidine kinase
VNANIPVCLTIAGSDSGGGAGIQADLRTFHCHGVFGTSVITTVTAQNPREVTAIHAIPLADIVAQYQAVMGSFRVKAIKTGMLYNAVTIETLASELEGMDEELPLVVDPVMVATSGARLLEPDAVAALLGRILPLATLITPNIPEAEIIAGESLTGRAAVRAAARRLSERHGIAVLLKGGHGEPDAAIDYLAWDDRLYELQAPRVQAIATHGTGCTLSAAITAQLATHGDLLQAVVAAKAFVYHSLRHARCVGPGLHAMVPPAEWDASVVQVKLLDTR